MASARWVEIYRGRDRQWYYRWKSPNGRIVAPSQGYTRRWSAKRAARKSFGRNVEIRYTLA